MAKTEENAAIAFTQEKLIGIPNLLFNIVQRWQETPCMDPSKLGSEKIFLYAHKQLSAKYISGTIFDTTPLKKFWKKGPMNMKEHTVNNKAKPMHPGHYQLNRIHLLLYKDVGKEWHFILTSQSDHYPSSAYTTVTVMVSRNAHWVTYLLSCPYANVLKIVKVLQYDNWLL